MQPNSAHSAGVSVSRPLKQNEGPIDRTTSYLDSSHDEQEFDNRIEDSNEVEQKWCHNNSPINDHSPIRACVNEDECMLRPSMTTESKEDEGGIKNFQKADRMVKEQELDVVKRVLCQMHFGMNAMKLRAEALQNELVSQDDPNLTKVLDFIHDFLSLPPIPSALLSDCGKHTVESQTEVATMEELLYQPDELEQSVDELRSVVDENGVVIDSLHKLHLNSINDLRRRLQILYTNNKLLTSIIDDNNQHTHELMLIINEKNAEILRLKNSYEDTISSLNSQLFSTQTELRSTRMDREILMDKSVIQETGEDQEQKGQTPESGKEIEILQKRIEELEMEIMEMKYSNEAQIAEAEQEAETRVATLQRETEEEIRSLEAEIHQKDAELEQYRGRSQELEALQESQKMDCSLQLSQVQCMKAVQTAILHVMDRLERNRTLHRHAGIISTYEDPIQDSPVSYIVSPIFGTIETSMGSVSMSDPESISRLIKSLSIRLKMAEAKVASLERTSSREDLLRDELQRKTEELTLIRGELQKSKGESVDRSRERMIENLSRNNEILKRNEKVYRQVLKELKKAVRRKDKQLQEFRIILEGVRKTNRMYFVCYIHKICCFQRGYE